MTSDLFAEPSGPFTEESDAFSITDDEQLVVGAVGGRSCDVWVEVPEDWVPGAKVALYGRSGRVRTELANVALADAKGTVTSGTFRGVALRSRGQPCDGFELTFQWVTPAAPPFDVPDGSGRAQLQVSNIEAVARVEQVDPPVRKVLAPAGTATEPVVTHERLPAASSTEDNPSAFKSSASTDCAIKTSAGWLLALHVSHEPA